MKTAIATLSLITAMGASLTWAEGLPITPGMWHTTTTIESSLMGTRTTDSKDCIKETELDPKTQMQGMPEDQCKVKTKISGNSMSYEMDCSQSDAMQMTGSGNITVDGDKMEGVMKMQGNMAGQTMTMTTKSSGKRMGDC